MVKKTVLLMLVLSLVQNVWAGESGFVKSSEDIVDQLTQKSRFGATRSFFVPETKTRAITVRVKDKNQKVVQDKQVYVQENSPEGVARMKVEFDVNSSRLRTSSYEILDQLGLALGDVRLAGSQVCIKGHTDSDGSEQYNLELSYDRAEAVKEYVLTKHNLEKTALFVVGYGEQMPLALNDSTTHKQMNRRVELTLGCSEVQ